MSIEVRVGAFVLAAMAVLVGFVLALNHFTWGAGFDVAADFAYTGGLQIHAPVKLGGLRIGRVADVALLDLAAAPPPASPRDGLGTREWPAVRARLILETAAGSVITASSVFAIATEGVVGETYVEITPGKPGEPPLATHSVVRGVDAPRLNELVLRVATLVEMLQIWASAAGPDGAAQGAAFGRSLARLIDAADAIVVGRRAEIETAITQIARAAGDLADLTRGLRQAAGANGERVQALLADGGAAARSLRTDLPSLLRSTQESVTAVEQVARRIEQVVDATQVTEAVADMRVATEKLQRLATQIGEVVAQVQSGDGALGGFVTDPQIYDDLKDLVADLKSHPWKVLWRN